jgi:hypothetical protein
MERSGALRLRRVFASLSVIVLCTGFGIGCFADSLPDSFGPPPVHPWKFGFEGLMEPSEIPEYKQDREHRP